jgi:sporulation protein YlmC with PRC-barrel domain
MILLEDYNMSGDDKKYSKQIIGKIVVSKAGKRFGEVGSIVFETRTGELIQIVLRNPTGFTEGLDLDHDKSGNLLIPYSAVIAIGDFVVVAEEDII